MSATGITLPHRVLVVGHYPPWPEPGAAATLAVVRRLLDEGHDVEVLSDRPSAAHDSADLRGVAGGLALARRARSFDAVVVLLEPDLFGPPDVGRLRRAGARVALAAALRRWPVSVVAVDLSRYYSNVAARPSRMVWQAAGEVWVPAEHDRRTLTATGAVTADRVVVQDLSDATPTRRDEDAWALSDAISRDSVLAEIRSRATARATVDAAGPVPAPPAWPRHPAPVRSDVSTPARPARLGLRDYASLAKRAAAKAVRTVRG